MRVSVVKSRRHSKTEAQKDQRAARSRKRPDPGLYTSNRSDPQESQQSQQQQQQRRIDSGREEGIIKEVQGGLCDRG